MCRSGKRGAGRSEGKAARAHIELLHADTIAALQSAYNAGVANIAAVSVLRVAFWKYLDTLYENPASLDLACSSLMLRACHPDGEDTPGRVAIEIVRIGPENEPPSPSVTVTRRIPQTDPNAVEAVLSITGTETFEIVLRARNLCGPSEMTVKLRPPSPT